MTPDEARLASLRAMDPLAPAYPATSFLLGLLDLANARAAQAEKDAEALTVEACASRQVGGLTAAEWRERYTQACHAIEVERARTAGADARTQAAEDDRDWHKKRRDEELQTLLALVRQKQETAAEVLALTASRDSALAALAALQQAVRAERAAPPGEYPGGCYGGCSSVTHERACDLHTGAWSRVTDALSATPAIADAFVASLRASVRREAIEWVAAAWLRGDALDSAGTYEWLRSLAEEG